MDKFILKCSACGKVFNNFGEWFENAQTCPTCGKNRVEVVYNHDYTLLKSLIYQKNCTDNTIWRYFDFMPLNNRDNIVSHGEGNVSINRWEFLERHAANHHGIDCKIYVYRADENPATRTFKDAGASLAASVLKELGVKNYVVASTGNVANAFAYYMAKAGISLSAFIPSDALVAHSAGVSYYGQRVFRVNGDYSKAKEIAREYAAKYKIPMTGGNTDPLRVEAKRSMIFDWLRATPEFPTVYIQALSGGTGPVAIDKAIREIAHTGLIPKAPRFIMIQPSACAPMAEAWEKAKTSGFPEGWRNKYPIYENPETSIPTLATGNPASYPIVGELVRQTGGEIFSFDESRCEDIARLIAYETLVRIGPASAIALGGFFDSLKRNLIRNGDVLMINIGESIDRAPDFFTQLIYTEKQADSVNDCKIFDRTNLQSKLWDKVLNYEL
ncbi:MAG: pyridoxal-phosphate dependent enzyme [Prevotellaceae bacterium]|jgi:threonine synthase|nr:pyridoxal-phosphate dependent enzyme [Prevotellaceae bacterium]